MELGSLPEQVEYGGLIFTRYEVEQAIRRWRSRKMKNPLEHPNRSVFVSTAVKQEQRTQQAIEKIKNAYQKVTDDIETAKTEILVKISERDEVADELKREIHLRHTAEKRERMANNLVKAKDAAIQEGHSIAEDLRKTIDRYEIRYRTLRNEYPLNWVQRLVGWLFRIC